MEHSLDASAVCYRVLDAEKIIKIYKRELNYMTRVDTSAV